MTWEDTDDIVDALMEAYPETDPLHLSFPRFQEMIKGLPGFDDADENCNEGVLEAIQMAWYEMRK